MKTASQWGSSALQTLRRVYGIMSGEQVATARLVRHHSCKQEGKSVCQVVSDRARRRLAPCAGPHKSRLVAGSDILLLPCMSRQRERGKQIRYVTCFVLNCFIAIQLLSLSLSLSHSLPASPSPVIMWHWFWLQSNVASFGHFTCTDGLSMCVATSDAAGLQKWVCEGGSCPVAAFEAQHPPSPPPPELHFTSMPHLASPHFDSLSIPFHSHLMLQTNGPAYLPAVHAASVRLQSRGAVWSCTVTRTTTQPTNQPQQPSQKQPKHKRTRRRKKKKVVGWGIHVDLVSEKQ